MLILFSIIPLIIYGIYFLFTSLVLRMPSIDSLISCPSFVIILFIIDVIPIIGACLIPFLIKKIAPLILKKKSNFHKNKLIITLGISLLIELILLTVYFLPSLINAYQPGLYGNIINALNRIQFEILFECMFINTAILYYIFIEERRRMSNDKNI